MAKKINKKRRKTRGRKNGGENVKEKDTAKRKGQGERTKGEYDRRDTLKRGVETRGDNAR